jgi:hypothetical protein
MVSEAATDALVTTPPGVRLEVWDIEYGKDCQCFEVTQASADSSWGARDASMRSEARPSECLTRTQYANATGQYTPLGTLPGSTIA